MLMLAGYRNLLQINRQLLEGHFPRTEYFGRSFMIKGKTVGVLGLGHIGKKVAALVTAFGRERHLLRHSAPAGSGRKIRLSLC